MSKLAALLKVISASVLLVLMTGMTWQAFSAHRDVQRFPAPGKLYSVGAHSLHLRCIGEGLPTVLMFSGGGTPSAASYELQDRLSVFTRTCSYDRAGLGWSDAVDTPQGFSESITDLGVLLSRAGEQGPFVLAPESYGGLIALGFAQQNPERVAGLVLIDSAEPKLWFLETRKELGQSSRHNIMMQVAWRTGLVRAVFPFAKPDWVDDMTPENRARFTSLYSRPITGYNEASVAHRFSEMDDFGKRDPGSLGSTPMLVLVHGENLGVLSESVESGWMGAQHSLASLSTDSEVHILDGVGHAMAEEAPERVALMVRSFVDRVRVRDQDERE